MTEPQRLAYSPAPAALPAPAHGESPEIVDLPSPMLDSDVPLMAALATRMSFPRIRGRAAAARDARHDAVGRERDQPPGERRPHGAVRTRVQ